MNEENKNMKNTWMKKVISFTAIAALVSGCSSSAAKPQETEDPFNGVAPYEVTIENPTGILKKIKEKGVLVIGTSPDYPPMEFINDEGEIKGAEITLAKYIAASLGVELQIEQMDFNAVLTAVDTGKVDLGMSGYGYKKDRAENFELSLGYNGDNEASCHGLLIPADQKDAYKTLDDFSGKKIIAQASSLQQMYVEDEIPDAQLELVTTIDQGIMNLSTGKVDAVALDCTQARNFAANSNGQFVKSDVEFDLTPYNEYAGNIAIAKKGETALMDALNQIIAHVNETGAYQGWYDAAKKDAGIQ